MQEEEEFEELSDEEKDHVLELIESGELDIKDVDPRDLPSRDRVTPTAFNSFGNYVIFICTKSSTYLSMYYKGYVALFEVFKSRSAENLA